MKPHRPSGVKLLFRQSLSKPYVSKRNLQVKWFPRQVDVGQRYLVLLVSP